MSRFARSHSHGGDPGPTRRSTARSARRDRETRSPAGAVVRAVHGTGRRMRLALLALAVTSIGCVSTPGGPAHPPEPDRAFFDEDIYPLLLRDCAFPECHASTDRFFRVFGPGRARLSPDTSITAAATEAEREEAYQRARSMLSGAATAERTLLVRKPLEVDRGGAPHMGIDEQGRDVYPSPDYASYRLLLEWVATGLPRGAP